MKRVVSVSDMPPKRFTGREIQSRIEAKIIRSSSVLIPAEAKTFLWQLLSWSPKWSNRNVVRDMLSKWPSYDLVKGPGHLVPKGNSKQGSIFILNEDRSLTNATFSKACEAFSTGSIRWVEGEIGYLFYCMSINPISYIDDDSTDWQVKSKARTWLCDYYDRLHDLPLRSQKPAYDPGFPTERAPGAPLPPTFQNGGL